MWTAYLDTSRVRARATRAAGRFSRRAYYGPLAPLRLRSVPSPALPGPQWVRVTNQIAGMGRADLDLIRLATHPDVSLASTPLPRRLYLGRQVVGTVAEAGPATELLRPGDRVAYQFDACCLTKGIEPPCRHCAGGQPALCEHRYDYDGPQQVGAAWGDEMVVHERQLFLVPDALTDEQAALLGPVAEAIHTALRRQPQPAEQVLVLGSSVEGLLLIQALRALSPNAVVTVLLDDPQQAEFAARMGASLTLTDKDSPADVGRMIGARVWGAKRAELFSGGFDLVYCTRGDAASLQKAVRWVRQGGTVVLAAQVRHPHRLDLSPVWSREVTLVGTTASGTETWYSDTGASGGRVAGFALAAALIREGRLTPERLVTHRFPLRELRRALLALSDARQHRMLQVLLDLPQPVPGSSRRAVHRPVAV